MKTSIHHIFGEGRSRFGLGDLYIGFDHGDSGDWSGIVQQ